MAVLRYVTKLGCWFTFVIKCVGMWLYVSSFCYIKSYHFFSCGAATQRGSWPPHSWGFLDHTQRRTTVGRTPLDKWWARRRDPYLTTHNTHNRQISMPPMGFEPTISAGERPQTYALESAATGTGKILPLEIWIIQSWIRNIDYIYNKFFCLSLSAVLARLPFDGFK
jgi:hypothetical protein